MKFTKQLACAAFALIIAAGSTSMAADKHAHGAKHGGQFIETENHQGVEMVVAGDALAFHITENDKPADLKGASMRAVIQTDGGVKTYPLTVEGSTLKVKLAAPLPSGAKVALTGKDGHGHALQVRFVKK